ncbi:helix-turn-helix domain-containing protein [Virgisporangium aliadipatigenens]|uniref:helix-turn-helix domain-containing protein n=1 Tax=Virgisporangium aliadipatigenens TaxID=741659 RepID=UPI0027E3CBF6|nr:helix-turn-helix domain-containing protein [Virgisporangium aliadipatigenens]
MGGSPGPELPPVVLSVGECVELDSSTRRRSTAQALALRARTVSACADGLSDSDVARLLAVSRPTVTTWRARFLADRVEGLFHEARPGRPRTVSDAGVADGSPQHPSGAPTTICGPG